MFQEENLLFSSNIRTTVSSVSLVKETRQRWHEKRSGWRKDLKVQKSFQFAGKKMGGTDRREKRPSGGLS